MAASGLWRRDLNYHAIFSHLRDNIDKLSTPKEATNIFCVYDGEIFAWNSSNSTILSCNLKFLVGKSETETKSLEFQTLLCTEPPTFEVESLVLSESGSYIALIGQGGVSVLELPQKWGKYGSFEGGKSRIMCRTTPVGERIFVGSKVKVLHASWHPACTLERHITLLTSDNTIRIFSLANAQAALRTYSLDTTPDGSASPAKLRMIQSALGEAAVSFDYAPPVKIKRKNKSATTEDEFTWPVFILWGNGDVYTLNTSINENILDKSKLEGPLSMFPPAEDNYGTDACSIICLYTRPSTLVIATCEGKLHHCIVLTTDNSQSEVTTESTASLYEAVMTSQRLYVYETVCLELSLTTPTLDDSEMIDVVSCPIRLHKDPVRSDRFHCSHSAGVHTVALPWQHRFQQFCDADETAELPDISPDEQSIVEHLVCTKPLPSSEACPVRGLCVCADRLLGRSLLCLTIDCQCIALPLATSYKTAPPPLLSDAPMQVTSPMRRMNREPFDQHVRKLLQRSASNPLIKTNKTTLTPQECLQLLSRATQVFREEYVQKQDLAREEIEKRVRVLREHKEQQVADLEDCEKKRNILTDMAQYLAERYETSNDNQQELVHRVETVLKKLQAKLPVLSVAEKNMQKELHVMQGEINKFEQRINQLKMRKEYNDREIQNQKNVASAVTYSKTQTQQLRTIIKREGEDIADIVKQINALKVNAESTT